jgi:hypothetical protein
MEATLSSNNQVTITKDQEIKGAPNDPERPLIS